MATTIVNNGEVISHGGQGFNPSAGVECCGYCREVKIAGRWHKLAQSLWRRVGPGTANAWKLVITTCPKCAAESSDDARAMILDQRLIACEAE